MHWGIDLGGTKIEGVVLSAAEANAVLARQRIDTERDYGYQHILDRVALLVEQLSQQVGERPSRIGVGTPGAMHPTRGTLRNSNTLCLNDQNLVEDLQRKLNCEVRIANDANCFALAEATMGAGQGHKTVFGVILGTGVGGGIVHNSALLVGAQGIGGEWGHNVVDEQGVSCYCGKSGCVETVISGPALEQFYFERSGEQLDLKAIAHRRDADPAAAETIERLHNYFGKAIAVVVNLLDPDCIVLGGGVSNIDSLYTLGAEQAKQYIFSDSPQLKIVRNSLGDSAGVFGAALL